METFVKVNHTMLGVIKGDITKFEADIIVNAANSSLLGGGGVDGAIHKAGGKRILEECVKIRERQGGCSTGEAVITTAGSLPASYVVHTVGPVWNGGLSGESEKLGRCYRNSLQLSAQHKARSIAFPNISTGIYRFPKLLAADIAIETVTSYLHSPDQNSHRLDMIAFVCFDDENYAIYSNKLSAF